MGYFFGQASFQMHMVINHREVLLLQPDDGIGLFVDGRKGVVLVPGLFIQWGNGQLAELGGTCYSFQYNVALTEQSLGIIGGTVRVRWFCITNHIGAIDLNGDVLVADSYLKVEPFPVFCQ